jgi:hypothetical protein
LNTLLDIRDERISENPARAESVTSQERSREVTMLVLAASALTLILTDVQRLPLARPALESAAAAALADSGLEPRWETAPPGADRAFGEAEVRVILLAAHPRSGGELILGSVLRQPARTPALWVYVGDIRRVIDAGVPGRSTGWQLSVAIGRVIAHEVAHLVAPQQPHAEHGLMGRRVDRQILLQAEAPLDAGCRSAIRTALTFGLGSALAGGGSAFTIAASQQELSLLDLAR